ncbi:NmrA family NAD(P)-binding protein, partial [Nocardia salmonicida]|uniref:NmrA family NAD(P)-binding protein n=1 Tax=Nocardia salmonicida TaxID=53431 RepID=UPI0033DC7653
MTGATGRQGGAVSRALLADGWQVRALTRDPSSDTARALASLGAELVTADMADVSALHDAFDGAQGVYSVQNPTPYSYDDEVAQGTNVVIAAVGCGVGSVAFD